MDEEVLFEKITGCSYTNKIELQKLRDSVKPKPHLVGRADAAGCSFESIWEATVVESNNSSDSGSLIEEAKG